MTVLERLWLVLSSVPPHLLGTASPQSPAYGPLWDKGRTIFLEVPHSLTSLLCPGPLSLVFGSLVDFTTLLFAQPPAQCSDGWPCQGTVCVLHEVFHHLSDWALGGEALSPSSCAQMGRQR